MKYYQWGCLGMIEVERNHFGVTQYVRATDVPVPDSGSGDPLPGRLAPYVKKSSTSKAAADQIKMTAGSYRRIVYDFTNARQWNGATDEEMQIALGLHQHTQSPRRVELRDAMLVFDSGLRRPTTSGRKAVVWVTAPYLKR